MSSKKKKGETYLHDCPECLQSRVFIVEDTERELDLAGWSKDGNGRFICPNCYLARGVEND